MISRATTPAEARAEILEWVEKHADAACAAWAAVKRRSCEKDIQAAKWSRLLEVATFIRSLEDPSPWTESLKEKT